MRFSLLVPLLVALTACQPVPRVFERAPDSENGLLRLSDSHGILVRPVVDAPAATADGLAREMVAALIDRDVPAFRTSRNRSSMILTGTVVDPGRDAHIAWVLSDSQGEEVGRYEQSIEGTPIEPWAQADPALMQNFAAAAAPRIAAYIQENVDAEVVTPAIYVGAVNGAPGNGGMRLQAALRQGLRRLGARVASTPSEETLMASADVRVTSMPDDRLEVAIAWAVADPFGTEIGKIDQASPFAKSVVDNNWGELAREAGLAAAAGMVDLVSRIDWRNGFVAPEPGKDDGDDTAKR
ncbi:MAG: hypothetical protein O3B37_15185 [Proteobacteria bacterium]|nr:hypothetical protein [Pseudomonadota bacterium]